MKRLYKGCISVYIFISTIQLKEKLTFGVKTPAIYGAKIPVKWKFNFKMDVDYRININIKIDAKH